MTKPDGSYRVMSVEQLLPQSFGPSQLEEEKNQGDDEDLETAEWNPSSSRACSESSSEHVITNVSPKEVHRT